jgi:hypothetical protein
LQYNRDPLKDAPSWHGSDHVEKDKIFDMLIQKKKLSRLVNGLQKVKTLKIDL